MVAEQRHQMVVRRLSRQVFDAQQVSPRGETAGRDPTGGPGGPWRAGTFPLRPQADCASDFPLRRRVLSKVLIYIDFNPFCTPGNGLAGELSPSPFPAAPAGFFFPALRFLKKRVYGIDWHGICTRVNVFRGLPLAGVFQGVQAAGLPEQKPRFFRHDYVKGVNA